MGQARIRVFLVEDQALVLGALAALLDREDDIEIVGTATTAEQGLDEITAGTVDVVLTDIELPRDSGLDLAKALSESHPDIRVIVLTTFARSGYFQRAMAAGARGYILKDSPASELASAIRKVRANQQVVDPELVAQSWSDPNPLTEREQQCLRLAGNGNSNSQIADTVFLSEGTVRNYLSSALNKLDAANRTEAARLARQKGWI